MSNDVFPKSAEQLSDCLDKLRVLIDRPDLNRKASLQEIIDGITDCAAQLGAASKALARRSRSGQSEPRAARRAATAPHQAAEAGPSSTQESPSARTSASRLSEQLFAEIAQVKQTSAASEMRFRQLLDANIIGTYFNDAEGRIIDANEAFLKIVGYRREDLMAGKLRADQLTPAEFRQLDAWALEQLKKSGFCAPYEKEVTDKHGARIAVLTGTTRMTATSNQIDINFVINISERKRAERALKLARFSLDCAGDAIFWIGLDGKILYANRAASALLGYSTDELLAMEASDIGVEADRADWNILWEAAGQGEAAGQAGAVKFESQHRTRQGHSFPIKVTAWYLAFEGQEYIQAFVHDISERKRAEARLRESEQRYRDFVEQSSEGIFCFDLKQAIPLSLADPLQVECFYHDGYLAECNKALAQMYGFEQERDLLGTPPANVLGPAGPGRLEPFRAFIRAGYRLADAETREIDRHGQVKYFLKNLVGIIKNDELVQVWGNQRDITERKKVEARLKEQAALLNYARDAIMVRSLDNRIVFWNRGAERIYGWSADEMAGRQEFDYLSRPEDLPRLDEAGKKLYATGEWTGEWRHRTKRGNEITVESRWALVRDRQDEPTSVLIINTDITEKKELETRFLRAQRLQSLGTLAAGIAHDMNNVLSPILMAIEALRRGSTDEDDQYFLAMLKLNTERGAALVNQVLSFASGTEGERRALQLKYIVHEIVGLLKSTLPKNINVRFFLQEDLWVVDGDATQLNQVIMNLCVNAKDAMPQGGKLSITAENTDLNSGSEGRCGRFVVLTIADSGTGMPASVIDKIFEPFFTTKGPGKGTGLGLSTAISIVEAHGGFIDVASAVGVGTTFKVCLPASAAPAAVPDESKPAELPMGNGEILLVVDDETAILTSLKESLGRFGYGVITADNSDQAVSLYTANHQQISAVITDLMMPHQDGYELIRNLQQINPAVQIIATSGLDPNPELMEAVKHQRVRAFVRKPFALDELLKLLATNFRP